MSLKSNTVLKINQSIIIFIENISIILVEIFYISKL